MQEYEYVYTTGRPRIFKSPDELETYFTEYIEHCETNELMPNIAGFVTWLNRYKQVKLNRESYYEYAKYPEYSNTLKAIDDSLEDAVLNSKAQAPLIKMAYLNAKCGYANKIDFTVKQADADPQMLEDQISNYLQRLSADDIKRLGLPTN